MVHNPNFDVTQINKGLPGLRGPKSAVPTAAAAAAPAEAPASAAEEAAVLPENPQDVYQAGDATATVDTPPPAAAQVELPPQVQELKERIEGTGSHREELQDDLEQAISCFEEGEYAEAADLLEAVQAYLDLREEISSATGLSQARKNDLRQKAWQEYQGIAEDVKNGEPLREFTTTREALLNTRLDYYQGKHWGAGFTDFLENIETAINNGNLQAAEALLQFCDTILAAKKTINQLSTVINNDSIPQEVRDLYTQARAQLRAEVEDILAGNLEQAQQHAERAQQKLAQAQDQIAEINTAREAETQAAYTERAGYLIDSFGPNTDIFASLEEGLGAEGGQLCPLFEIVEDAREQGHFDEAALEALDKLSQLLRDGAQTVNRQQIFAAADQIRDYLAQLSQAQSTGGTLHLLSVRAAVGGTVGHGLGLASFAKNGTALTAMAEQQTNYQYLEALSASQDPDAQAAYQDLVAQLLDLDACRSVYDLSVVMDNFLYLRETGHLPPALQSVQSQNAFLQRIAEHPVVQQSLSDIETGKVVQIVESIAIVIVAAATAEIGGGFIAAELGIGGGAGGFLLTQAIVAPIFTVANGFASQGLGLSEGWETPVEFLENVATDYAMFVTLGAVAKGYAMLFRAPANPVGKLFYQGGSFAAEYLAFNGFTFAEQAVGSAFSEELTLSYVFSSENVQQVFMDNAVMLVGLKIGNFIAKPIISPLREGILERTRPDLAREARQLDVQGQVLAERLAEYQVNGGTGEQYVDIRADQISILQARVDFYRKCGVASQYEIRQAEAALESATVEYARLQEARVEEATIELTPAESTPTSDAQGTAVRTPNRINNTSYHLSALDNVAADIAYQVPTEQAEIFAQGARQQIWAKGMGGAENGGLKNLVSVALDGAVRSESTAEYGILTDGAQANGFPVGAQGPCFIVFDRQPTTRNVGAEHHAAYLVPNSYAKGLFEKAVREAVDAHTITAEQGEARLAKLYTQAEYLTRIDDPSHAHTIVSQSLEVKGQTLFTDEVGFMTFLQDANAQYYGPGSEAAAAGHWQAMQTHAAQLRAEYPGIPVYKAQALELIRARLSDLSPSEREMLIDIYGTDRPEIFFGDNSPDLNGLIDELNVLMHRLGVGVDQGFHGFTLDRDIAQLKSRLVALNYTIAERYAPTIPRSWWDGVSLDMADGFSFAIADFKESAGYSVVDSPALETYPIEMTLTKMVDGSPQTYTKIYNVELREVQYSADEHQDKVYFLADPSTGEVFPQISAKPIVDELGAGARRITILGRQNQVYGEIIINDNGGVSQIPTAAEDNNVMPEATAH